MKKIILGLLTLGTIGTMTLHAYSDADRIQDMQMMEMSMAKIQKGILYNNKEMVSKGVNKLKETATKVEISKKDDMDYSAKFSKKQSDNIMKFADKVQSEMSAGHKHGATANYTKVLNQCVSCHNKIRKWN